MGVVDSFIVYIASPSISASLHASFGEIQLVVAGYTLTYGVGLVTGGRLGDIIGRKKMFQIGTAAFTVTSLLSALAPNASLLVVARFLQGFAAAAMLPQVISLIQVSFPQHERNRAFGIFGAVNGSSAVAGQVIGGLLLKANIFGLGWRLIFMVNIPIGILSLVLSHLVLHEARDANGRSRRLDIVGMVSLGLAVFLVIYPLARRSQGWSALSSAEVIVSGVLFVAFFLYEGRLERRGVMALVPLRLFRMYAYRNGLFLRLLFASGASSIFLGLSFYFQSGAGLSPLVAALVFVPVGVGFVLSSILTKRVLPKRWGGVVVFGSIMSAGGLTLIALVALMGGGRHLGLLEPGLSLFGFGQGFIATGINPIALFGLKDEDAGAASGVLLTVQTVAGSLGVAILGTLYISVVGSLGRSATSAQHLHHYGRALAVVACVVAGLVLVLGAIARVLPKSFAEAQRRDASDRARAETGAPARDPMIEVG